MFDPEQIAQLQKIIRDLYGLVLGPNHMNELLRSLKTRIQELNLGSLSGYIQLIRNGKKSEELENLVSQITVGETSFFRTPQQLWALRDFVFPQLIKQRQENPKKKLRFLSAGCATGEEPYSLAMVALEMENGLGPNELEILAFDVNSRFLEEAREGIYPFKDIRNLDARLRAGYFEEKEKHFHLKKSVKELVKFVHFNLARDDFQSLVKGGLFDAIFCRNVLIYFDQQVFLRTVESFHQMLENQGYLFLGYSESLYGLEAKFDCIYVPGTFFYQKFSSPKAEKKLDWTLPAKPEAARPARPRAPHKPRPHKQPPAVLKAESVQPRERITLKKSLSEQIPLEELWKKGWELFEQEEYEQARSEFEKIIQTDPSSAKGYLGVAFVWANQGENQKSEKYLQLSFEKDSLIPEGYYLLGLLAERKEEWEKAIENYQRAIFLKSDFIIAHFNLASLYFRLAELTDAERELKVVNALLQAGPRSIYLSGGWTPKALLDWTGSHLQRIQELRE